ncbi:MAG: ABC transporter ATP-binding protein [Actinobacteria bacterium]|nr:ABC transporter ATP-binding protein [Actinomycetota bacterium]
MTDIPPPPPPPPPPPIASVLLPPPPHLDDLIVVVDRVSKWFGGVVAVSEVTFGVGAGVTAVLGPNGAGKSTLLRLLCGLTAPSMGTVRIGGADPRTDSDARRRIGLVPQQETMFDSRTPLAFVALIALLHGIDDPDDAARRALAKVELDPADTRRIATYSKGMRQRVKVAAALVHDPDILVLDEPLTGLDPRQRRHMIELFHRLGEEGRCVLVSSHVLDEVERFGSRVLVLAKGRLAATGEFRAIRDLMDDRPHRIQISTDDPGRLAGALLGAGSVSGVRLVDASTVHVETTDVALLRSLVATTAVANGLHLREFAPLDDDLDSVFRYLVGGR